MTALLFLGHVPSALAYDLYNEANCNPGRKWGTVKTVKVRFLAHPADEYAVMAGGTDGIR